MTSVSRGMGLGRSRLAPAVVLVLAATATVVLAGTDRAAAAADSSYQWGLAAVGAPTAWAEGTGVGVRIGIVDTGVDLSQEDLQGRVVAATTILSQPSSGCATASQDPTAGDDFGHGTHVAGIAAASGQVAVSGVAPSAELVVAKVLDCTGTGSISDVVAGIRWVVDHGARVVNLSLGDQISLLGGTSGLSSGLEYAWSHGAVAVVAAGNNGNGLLGLGISNTDFSQDHAIVVAATGPTGGIASYSNRVTSAMWGLAAPGGDDPAGPSTPTCGRADPDEILSTYWTAADPTSCVTTDEGTSMATPFVTGTLALLLGRGLDPTQAVRTILGSATHPPAMGSCGIDCSGFLDTAAAMAAAARLVPSPPTGTTAGPGRPVQTTLTTAPSTATPVSPSPPAPVVAAGGSVTSTPNPAPTEPLRPGPAPAPSAASGGRQAVVVTPVPALGPAGRQAGHGVLVGVLLVLLAAGTAVTFELVRRYRAALTSRPRGPGPGPG